ncbi:hypothetical protein KY347_07195 [Candidatus Woesearchaeota archaeon]|nr:hypothetical protein [Candidatus Woesearchaeota archaeon]
MLNFIKKFFAKEEIPEEKIGLGQLSAWLDEKAKPIFEELNAAISRAISSLNDEKQKLFKNLEILEKAKLQNPKIPERIKTIMEGNRSAFIKKVSLLFSNIDLSYTDYDELIKKCQSIINELDALAKSTAKSYQVLNEFFAREAGNAASNIKKAEDFLKEIIEIAASSKISKLKKTKSDIEEIKGKIELKKQYLQRLWDEKNTLKNIENEKLTAESKIREILSGKDYRDFENLLVEKKSNEFKLVEIENTLFHDFSVIEKALKKYSKIAFENENLIVAYLKNPIKALASDNGLKIMNILNDLEKSISGNKLELDAKKIQKTISKIKELDPHYFSNNKHNFEDLNEKLAKISLDIENNKSNNGLKLKREELKNIKYKIENLNSNILSISNGLEKINISELKENLQNEINKNFNAKITVA